MAKYSSQRIRLYDTTPLSQGQLVSLSSQHLHYLRHVLRQKPGDTIYVFNESSGEWQCTIDTISKKEVTIHPEEQSRKKEVLPYICLYFAPVKQTPLHNIIQKATELGVSEFQPIITDYTNIHRLNLKKLTTIAIEAAEQCERLSIPTIHAPTPLSSLLSNFPHNIYCILCDESGRSPGAYQQLSALRKTTNYAVMIGPEGGFSDAELTQLHQHKNMIPMGLGPRILRADTAVCAALTCFQCFLGDWDESPHFKRK